MFAKIKFVLSEVFDFLLPFIKVLLTQGGKILMEASLIAVKHVATTMSESTGAEKRAAAFDIIKGRLAASGFELTTAVINSAIEAALIKLKESGDVK